MVVLLLAAAGVVSGLLWDISWDASFGRDSFWAPPHVLMNLSCVLGWCAALGIAARATYRGEPAAVRLGILRAPIGGGFILWGGLATLASGALDRWWSRAYGLATSSWPPPQVLFTAGVGAMLIGVLVCAASDRNRRRPHARFVLLAAALLLAFSTIATGQYSLPNLQRTALFYAVSCAVYPGLLVAMGQATPWGATRTALLYMTMIGAAIWILPLLPAEPLVGPVYQHIERMIPPRFPLLLVVPAVALDALGRLRPGNRLRSDVLVAALLGIAFAATFIAVQWPFAAFLLSPASDNRFFAGGGRYWPVYANVGDERTLFWGQEESPLTMAALLECTGLAIATASFGMAAGRWMGRLRR